MRKNLTDPRCLIFVLAPLVGLAIIVEYATVVNTNAVLKKERGLYADNDKPMVQKIEESSPYYAKEDTIGNLRKNNLELDGSGGTVAPPAFIVPPPPPINETYASCNVTRTLRPLVTEFAAATAPLLDFMTILPQPLLARRVPFTESESTRPYATCAYQSHYMYSDHFPHFLQQLTRCWSFWETYPGHQRVFLLEINKNNKKNKYFRKLYKSSFVPGILKALEKSSSSSSGGGGGLITSRDTEAFYKNEKKAIRQRAALAEEATTTTTTTTTTFVAANNNATSNNGYYEDTDSVSAKCTRNPAINGRDQASYMAVETDHIRSFRRAVLDGLDLTTTKTSQSPGETGNPTIALLDRRRSRKVHNAKELVEALNSRRSNSSSNNNNNANVTLEYMEGLSFREQAERMSRWDIVVTPHGAQETSLFLMPDCGGIIEILPKRYYKAEFFGSLAAISGIRHTVIHNTENDPDFNDTIVPPRISNMRYRDTDTFCPSYRAIKEALDDEILRWKSCHKKKKLLLQS